jgi:hypothetical protein
MPTTVVTTPAGVILRIVLLVVSALRTKIANTANCRSERISASNDAPRQSFRNSHRRVLAQEAPDALPEARHGIISIDAIALVMSW